MCSVLYLVKKKGAETSALSLLGQALICSRIQVGVCRKKSVKKLDRFEGRIKVVPGATNDPILESNLTRRVDYALFMVEALKNDELIHEAPAIVGCRTASALEYATPHN